MSKQSNISAMRPLAIAVALTSGAVFSTPTLAQDAPRRGTSAALLEEVVVTARKREEGAQEVPLSVTAFNADQINALKVRDLNDLTVGMPNVSLEDVGTTRGTANFSIRGIGINSSIPSIDPTVGVFMNNVFIGTNQGIIFDMFDVESLEVLRDLGNDIGAVLVESVQSRKPEFHDRDYIKALRDITQDNDTALILDEVVTGFRVDAGGIRKLWDIIRRGPCFQFVKSRRQAGHVIVHASNQSSRLCRGCGLKSVRFQLRQNECIDGIGDGFSL